MDEKEIKRKFSIFHDELSKMYIHINGLTARVRKLEGIFGAMAVKVEEHPGDSVHKG